MGPIEFIVAVYHEIIDRIKRSGIQYKLEKLTNISFDGQTRKMIFIGAMFILALFILTAYSCSQRPDL